MINLTQRWTQLWPFSKITTISLIFKNGRRALPPCPQLYAFHVWIKSKLLLTKTFNVCMQTLSELCVSHRVKLYFFTKTLLLFHISLLKRLIYRTVNTSQILLGATVLVTLSKNQVKAIYIHFIRKTFPSSKGMYCISTRNLATSHMAT